jgi:hypothetical protein
MFSLEFIYQLFEDGEAFLDVFVSELSQGHLLDVVADLYHLFLHHVNVEDELD